MGTPFSKSLVAILAGLLIIPTYAAAGSIVFSDSGPNAAAIQDTVDAFRTVIGGVNNGNAPGPLDTGRREINWDGGGAASPFLADMPKDLFQNRGAFFGPDVTTFAISGAPDPRFGNINPTYADNFTTFSAPRLFSPTNSVATEQIFFVPGSDIRATTTAFGAVFTNVELENFTSIQYFGLAGEGLGTFFAPPASGGLSFLGVGFTDGELIDRVVLTSGNSVLGLGIPNGGGFNVVAMDDFIYAEPQAVIPEPSTLLLLGTGLTGLWWGRRQVTALC